LYRYNAVLTTYDVLRNDLHHNPGVGDAGAGRQYSGRFQKKYQVIPTPLTRLTWWR
jgi:E3 ubiquitin-protein ligase SHPRH